MVIMFVINLIIALYLGYFILRAKHLDIRLHRFPNSKMDYVDYDITFALNVITIAIYALLLRYAMTEHLDSLFIDIVRISSFAVVTFAQVILIFAIYFRVFDLKLDSNLTFKQIFLIEDKSFSPVTKKQLKVLKEITNLDRLIIIDTDLKNINWYLKNGLQSISFADNACSKKQVAVVNSTFNDSALQESIIMTYTYLSQSDLLQAIAQKNNEYDKDAKKICDDLIKKVSYIRKTLDLLCRKLDYIGDVYDELAESQLLMSGEVNKMKPETKIKYYANLLSEKDD